MKRTAQRPCASALVLLAFLAVAAGARPKPSATPQGDWPVDTLLRTLPLRPQSLQFPGGRGAWDAVNERFAEVLLDGNGSVRVVHLGGSHVQAGWMGERVRERWWTLSGTLCSRGLLAPYRLAGTNSPPGFHTGFTESWVGSRCAHSRHPGPFGGTGLSATTFHPGATWWHASTRIDSGAFRSTEMTVLAESNGLLPRWNGSDTSVHAVRTPLADGTGWRIRLSSPVDTLFLGLEADSVGLSGPPWFRLHGIVAAQPECPCEGLVYHEVGNNGASTASVLRGASDSGFERDWRALNPDLVIFGIGINDAHCAENRFDANAFTARYDSLIGLIQAAVPSAAFLFLTNTDSSYDRRPNPAALAVREAMMDVARRHGAAVFDLFDAMGGLGAMGVWADAGFAQSDLIHFTREGYRVLADLYWDAVLGDWAASGPVRQRRVHVARDSLLPVNAPPF